MKRGFEKISYSQFEKDVSNNKRLYNEYNLPKRSTKCSAGYDFFAIDDFIIEPGEIKKIPTGIKVFMGSNEMLMLMIRSSMGFKYNVRLCNQVGIIESDYYNNIDNEGHIWVALKNEGEKAFGVIKGDRYIQGVFTEFLTVDDEEEIKCERVGGIGSTNQGEKNEK